MIEEKKLKKFRFNRSYLLLIILSFISVGMILIGGVLCPQIKLKGSEKVIINYKEVYKEAGYSAKMFNKNITDKVKVKGSVNSDKLGVYKLTYVVDGLFKKEVVRTVEVKDISKPVIEISNDDVYLCPGSKYKKEDVKAYDNYDGDISKNVLVDIKDDRVIYSVKDSSGNDFEVVKKLIFEDKEKPIINLNGGNHSYAFLNEDFKDPGYSANDNCGGDISQHVKVSSSVNISKSGTYDIKYSVSDASGNSTDVIRKVVVSERGKNGTVYLTFDDGPQRGTTDVILDILKEEGVEATFFITNKGDDSLIKRMYDEGHTVAIHTATHDYATVYASVDSYFNDLNIVNERIKRITGEYSYIVRFPGGSSNTISRRYSQGIMSTLTQEVVNRGYKYYDWNISSGDAAGGSPSPETIKNNVVNALRKDRINMVLMHDIKTYTRDALRSIIRYGKDNGYTFEKITINTEMVKQRVNN